MSSRIPFTTQSNADVSKCFKWRKRGENKIYWWVISGKCLQDKYQKYNFIGEGSKQSAQKLESWCKTLKSWQLQHLNVNLFCALDSWKRHTARCPVLVWYTVIKHDEIVRYKKWPQSFSRFAYKQCNLWNIKKLCFLCALILSRKKLHFQLGRFWRAFSEVLRYLTVSSQVGG